MLSFIQNRKKHLILTISLVFISFLYYLSSCYINCSNDGSHFALVSAMVNKNTTEISEYVNYTAKIDYAVKDGKYYSDRLPGNAFLMTPFFLFGKCLSHFDFKSSDVYRPIEEVAVVLESNVCGVLGVFFLFLIFRYFRFSFSLSLFSALTYAVCTLNWQESTHVFSHAASMCFVLMSIYFLLKSETIYQSTFLWSIFSLSYSLVIELQNVLLFIPVLLYVLKSNKIDFSKKSENAKTLTYSSLICFGSLFILLFYNYLTFREWILKSNKYNPLFPEEMSFFTSLSGDVFKGLDRLFTNFHNLKLLFYWELGAKNDAPGMFIISPILILAIPGFVLFFRKKRHEAILFLLIIAINVLIAACHKTVLVRHIFTITPFLYFPIIFVHQYFINNKNIRLKLLYVIIFIILSSWSAIRIFYAIHTYYGRELSNIFPFKKEMPTYFIFISAITIMVCFIILIKYLIFKQQKFKQQ